MDSKWHIEKHGGPHVELFSPRTKLSAMAGLVLLLPRERYSCTSGGTKFIVSGRRRMLEFTEVIMGRVLITILCIWAGTVRWYHLRRYRLRQLEYRILDSDVLTGAKFVKFVRT